jgi:hypothetical protein
MIVRQEFEGEIARVNQRQKQVSSCRGRSWRSHFSQSKDARDGWRSSIAGCGKVLMWAGDRNSVAALFASPRRISGQWAAEGAAVGAVVLHTQGREK